MKITKNLIALFEQEQRQYGTKVALQNFLWVVAQQILKDLGATRTR